jgi:uncharacterized protein YndB with AHSA1/START domain
VSEIRIVRDYPYPVLTLWRALTDPELVPLWTSTGRGGRPEGFRAEPGTKFRLIGKPLPGWDGIVRCEVLAADAPTLLRYDWRNKEDDRPTVVTNILAEIPGGTRLTWEHTGFQGIGGLLMAQLLGRVRRTMLSVGLPPVLADIGDDGRLRPGSALRARP